MGRSERGNPEGRMRRIISTEQNLLGNAREKRVDCRFFFAICCNICTYWFSAGTYMSSLGWSDRQHCRLSVSFGHRLPYPDGAHFIERMSEVQYGLVNLFDNFSPQIVYDHVPPDAYPAPTKPPHLASMPIRHCPLCSPPLSCIVHKEQLSRTLFLLLELLATRIVQRVSQNTPQQSEGRIGH